MTNEPPVLANRRTDYERASLDESTVGSDPLAFFAGWLRDAFQACAGTGEEAHAMSLATVDAAGAPSIRTVLLKGVDERGFVWFTNYTSRKGVELAANPHAALNFRWGALERQVSVRGTVTKVDEAESDEYFASRPVASRIGAIVSPQSSVVTDRSVLETAVAQLTAGRVEDLHRPAHWGGYRLDPTEIEFWQGRPSRLHDRLRFRRPDATSPWVRERLAP